jgi:myo-inositol-1-phosphate synthase
MSPTAINAPGHHDSFALPTGHAAEHSVHPSAKRGPEGGLIKVEGEDVVYEAEGVRAKFTDRGAAVTSECIGPLGR